MSLRGRTAPVAIRTSRLRSCLRRLPFFLRRKKGRKERRQNQWFWNPFRGQDTARSGTLQPRELSTAKFAPCFRIVSASPSATRSALVLPWRDGRRPLRLPCGAMWASRRTDILRAGAAGPMWAAAPTEHLTVDARKGRPPGRPEPGLHRCSCKPVITSR